MRNFRIVPSDLKLLCSKCSFIFPRNFTLITFWIVFISISTTNIRFIFYFSWESRRKFEQKIVSCVAKSQLRGKHRVIWMLLFCAKLKLFELWLLEELFQAKVDFISCRQKAFEFCNWTKIHFRTMAMKHWSICLKFNLQCSLRFLYVLTFRIFFLDIAGKKLGGNSTSCFRHDGTAEDENCTNYAQRQEKKRRDANAEEPCRKVAQQVLYCTSCG